MAASTSCGSRPLRSSPRRRPSICSNSGARPIMPARRCRVPAARRRLAEATQASTASWPPCARRAASKAPGCTIAIRPETCPKPRLVSRPARTGPAPGTRPPAPPRPARRIGVRGHTQKASFSSGASTTSRLALPGAMPVARISASPATWNSAAPPLACPVIVFWETATSGLPSLRPRARARRVCSSDSLGSLALVEVSCLEITAMSSASTPRAARALARRESLPPRPAPKAPSPGAGMEVWAPSA